MTTILIFGDSVTWGAWDSKGGWVARLRKDIDAKNISDPDFYCSVYNLGISGDTSAGVLARFERETKTRLKTEEEKPIIIIEIGDNDASYLKSKRSNRIPLEEFRKNIFELIRKAKIVTRHILLVSPTKVDETKTTPVPWAREVSYRNNDLKTYAKAMQEEAEKMGVPFVNTQTFFEEKTMLSADGLHPNERGHEEIYTRVKEILVQKKMLLL